MKDYVSIDLETTGLEPKHDKIIEIGAVRVKNGEVYKKYETLVNPGRELTAKITEITGIKDSDLTDAPYIEEIIDEVIEFIGEDILLGHSLLFDYSFLKRAAVNAGHTFEKKGIDTLKISRKYLTDLPSRSLGALCEHYEIEHQAHRALNDAMATHYLYGKLLDEFGASADSVFEPSQLIYQVKKEVPASKKEIERLLRVAAEKGVVLREDPYHLTRNEACRIVDKILSGEYEGKSE